MNELDEVLKHIDGEASYSEMILTDEHIAVLIKAAKRYKALGLEVAND